MILFTRMILLIRWPVQGGHPADHQVQPGDHGPVSHQLAEHDVPPSATGCNLLRDDGLIFISIDNSELANLRKMCDEVFGEENFVECIIWKKRYGGGPKERYLVNLQEYILLYCKSKVDLQDLFVPLSQESIERYYSKKDEFYDTKGPYRTQPLEAAKSLDSRENLIYPIPAPDGTEIWPQRQWLWSKETLR